MCSFAVARIPSDFTDAAVVTIELSNIKTNGVDVKKGGARLAAFDAHHFSVLCCYSKNGLESMSMVVQMNDSSTWEVEVEGSSIKPSGINWSLMTQVKWT